MQARLEGDTRVEQIAAVQAKGQEFLALIETLRTPMQPIETGPDSMPMAIGTVDRELNIAVERIEEAVMWAVKHFAAYAV